jgi:hypothetical protein
MIPHYSPPPDARKLQNPNRCRERLQLSCIMKNEPRQKTIDPNTEQVREKRSHQTAQKAVPGEAPLKNNGQPAWREAKND